MRFQLERLAFLTIQLALRILPRKMAMACGRAFGQFAFHLDRRHRRVAYGNLKVVFPEISPEEAEKILLECYRFFGSYLFDLLTFTRDFSGRLEQSVEFEGLEHLKAAYEGGKGVICFSGHWGAWEIMALAQGVKGFQLGILGRRLDNPYLEELLQNFRKSSGNFVIDKREGFRPMLRTLKQGKGIAILIDQDVIGEERIFVNFFGKPASTTPALALLKLKTDAAIIPLFAMPLPNNRYRLIYRPPVEVPLIGDRKVDVYRITQECTREIEEMIRRFPEYWLWMHRRWKTVPGPEEIEAMSEQSGVRLPQ
jgi:Kdo2-lipid IVA lauroyltransferase/acyltransferase